MKYRVLLIQPPYTLPIGIIKTTILPIGLCYIASVLETEGYEVKILDCPLAGFNNEVLLNEKEFRYGLGWDNIERVIRAFGPDFVGVSILFSQQAENAFEVCKISKRISRDIKVAIGGHHPSMLGEEILRNHKEVDFVVLGEGEYTFRELIRRHVNRNDISDIDGIVYRKKKTIIKNPKTLWISDLDGLPFPARHLCRVEKYFEIDLPQSGKAGRRGIRRSLQVISSRGCTRRCVFCGTVKLWGNRYRVRSPENFVSELEFLKREYKIQEFQIQDDNFTLNRERLRRILDLLIERRVNLSWCTPQGIDGTTLDEEIVCKMKKSGCSEVTLAIESGDEYVLKHIIKKPIKLKKTREVIMYLKKYKIKINSFFVVGFPGETKTNIHKTLNFADSLKLDRVSCFIATPLPGTELYDIAKERGFLQEGFTFASTYSKGWIKTEEFSPEYLEHLVSSFRRKQKVKSLLRHPIAYGCSYFMQTVKSPKAALRLFRP